MAWAKIKPASVYPYFDKIQVWLKEPADRQTIAKLRRACGHLHPDNRNARFGQGYRQRLEFKQPRDEVLQWLARQSNMMINHVEPALDYIFNNKDERDDAHEFMHRHQIRRWHGKTQKVRLVGGRQSPNFVNEVGINATRYDAARTASNSIVMYANHHSRITGELHCLHVEWRAHGARAVRGTGILSGKNLSNFNHCEFWRKHLLLVDVDPEQLGRLIKNFVNGSRSRMPDFRTYGKRTVNFDRKMGGVMLRAYGTMQEVIDAAIPSMRVQRVLTRISNDVLLPDNRQGSQEHRELARLLGILQ